MSPVTNANSHSGLATATKPHPANSPTMHSRLARQKEPHKPQKMSTKINHAQKRGSQSCNFSDTLFDQKSPVHPVPVAVGGTNKQKTDGHYNLYTESV